MTDKTLLGLFASLGLAIIHLFASKLRFLDVIPRSRWLSFAGGVSIAYALVHLLPELEKYASIIAGAGEASAWEHGLYLLTLAGLVVFYGLEKLAERSPSNEEEETSPGVFWIHISSFAIYNTLIGYTLVKEERTLATLAFFFVALALHFLVNDYGLRHHHQEQYRRWGRWIISFAVLAGWLIGVLASISEVITASIIGFLAGGILLNTFKEELPRERESRFWAFGLGAALYAGLLLII